jgi:hypothetical protein
MAEDYEIDSQSWLDKVKESPRTVSALIIVLIVVAAVYAFSGEEQEIPEEGLGGITQEAGLLENGSEGEAALEDSDGVVNQIAQGEEGEEVQGEELVVVTQDELAKSTETFPEASRTDAAYVEVAQGGDGVTHLARRAATRWLSENQTGYEVTNEHRIYIEDYIQNSVGTQGLALGEQVSIPYELVQAAVDAASNLGGQELQNLSQYTPALT